MVGKALTLFYDNLVAIAFRSGNFSGQSGSTKATANAIIGLFRYCDTPEIAILVIRCSLVLLHKLTVFEFLSKSGAVARAD
jgi:hypothetical protein